MLNSPGAFLRFSANIGTAFSGPFELFDEAGPRSCAAPTLAAARPRPTGTETEGTQWHCRRAAGTAPLPVRAAGSNAPL